MNQLLESKEFIELEIEEKRKFLELMLQDFNEEDLKTEISQLEAEKLSVENKISKLKEGTLSKVVSGMDLSGILPSINAELEDVKKQAGIFRQKAAELEKHKNALEIKNAIAKKDALTREVEDLKQALESLREQKLDSQNSLIEIRANFENFYNSYNEEMARLLFEEKKIHALANDDSLSEDVLNDRFKIEEKLKEKNEEILLINENIYKYKVKCEAVELEISEKQEEISKVNLPEERKELIVQAKDLESEIIIYDEMLSRVGKLIDGCKEDLENAKANYSAELAVERKIEEDFSKIQASTDRVFASSDMSDFEKLRNCDKSLADMQVVEYELNVVEKQIQLLNDKIKERTLKVDKIKNEILSAEEVLVEKRQIIKSLSDDLKNYREQREEMLGSNSLGLLSSYTNVGDNCPICKAKVYEKNHYEVFDLVGIDKEIEMMQNKISYAEKDKDMALSAIIALQAKLDFENEQIEFEQSQIKTLENSKIKIYQRVIDINDKTPENFIALKNALKKTTSALEDLVSLQDKLRDKIHENLSKKVEYGTKISLLTDRNEQLIDLYYVLQKERAERELLMLEAKFAVSGNDFEQKRSEFAGYEEIKSRLIEEVLDLYLQLSELKTNIFVEEEKLASLEFERGKLESKLSSEGIAFVSKSEELNSVYTIEEIQNKKEELKETYKRLSSLKDNAENSLQNVIKEFEVKSELLKFIIDELHDVSALVSSLVFRYGFAGEEEVKLFIITDNMLKLKENEVKTYNNRTIKLELIRDYLDENNLSVETNNDADNIDDLIVRVGEINILLENKKQKIESIHQIESLIKKYSM